MFFPPIRNVAEDSKSFGCPILAFNHLTDLPVNLLTTIIALVLRRTLRIVDSI